MAKYVDDVETKRNTLLEIVDAVESAPRLYFGDARVMEDAFTMVGALMAGCSLVAVVVPRVKKKRDVVAVLSVAFLNWHRDSGSSLWLDATTRKTTPQPFTACTHMLCV